MDALAATPPAGQDLGRVGGRLQPQPRYRGRRDLMSQRTKAASSVLWFGCYLLALGIGLVAVPNTVLGIFSVPSTNEVWIRVVGVLAFNMGFLYVRAALLGSTTFFELSVPPRIITFVALTAFVALGLVKPIIILIAVV